MFTHMKERERINYEEQVAQLKRLRSPRICHLQAAYAGKPVTLFQSESKGPRTRKPMVYIPIKGR